MFTRLHDVALATLRSKNFVDNGCQRQSKRMLRLPPTIEIRGTKYVVIRHPFFITKLITHTNAASFCYEQHLPFPCFTYFHPPHAITINDSLTGALAHTSPNATTVLFERGCTSCSQFAQQGLTRSATFWNWLLSNRP